jgi:hypothetical protein
MFYICLTYNKVHLVLYAGKGLGSEDMPKMWGWTWLLPYHRPFLRECPHLGASLCRNTLSNDVNLPSFIKARETLKGREEGT